MIRTYVFDGTRSPLKATEDASRKSVVDDALERLAGLYERRDPADYETVEELQIKATTIRNDMIALVVENMRKKTFDTYRCHLRRTHN